MASISLLPHDTLFQIRPRTQVLIFYLSPVGSADPEELDPRRTDATALRHWKLLFAGETYTGGENLSGGSRSHNISARGHIGGLAREFLFTTTYSAAGGGADATVIADRSRFFGTLTGMLDDIVNDPATVVENAYTEKTNLHPVTKSVSGPLAGLMTLIEWQFGVHGAFAGANDFATLWARISRVQDQIVSDNGAAATKLFGETVFTKWLRNNLSDLGKVVSLETVSNLVLEFIQYQMLPCPVANFTPGSSAKPHIVIPPPPELPAASSSAVPVTAVSTGSSSTEIDLAVLNGADRSVLVGKGKIVGMTHTWIWYLSRLMTALKAAGRPAFITQGYRSPEDQAKIGNYHSPHQDGIAADLVPLKMLDGSPYQGIGFNSTFGRGYGGVILANGKGKPPTTSIWERAKWAAGMVAAWGVGGKLTIESRIGQPLKGRYSIVEKGAKAGHLFVTPDPLGEPLSGAVFSQNDFNVMNDLAHFYKLMLSIIKADPILRPALYPGAAEGFNLYKSRDPDIAFAAFGILGADPVHVQLAPGARIPSSLPTGKTTVIISNGVVTPTPPEALPGKAPTPPGVLPTVPPITDTSAVLTAAPAPPPPPDVIDTPRARLHSNLYLPDLWFCAAPLCNVIFREEIASLGSNNDPMSTVTRLELETPNAMLPAERTLSTNDVFYAPQLQTANSPNGTVVSNLKSGGLQTTAVSDGTDRALIYQHEKYSGIIPRQEFFGDYAITAYVDDVVASEGITAKDATVRLASAIAEWHFLKARSEAFSLSVELKFTPRLVVGMPVVILRKGREDGVGLPLCYLGKIASITHSISDSSASTSIAVSNVRLHRQESNPDDLFAGGLRLREQRPGSTTTTVIGLSKPMTSKDAEFLSRIYALARTKAISIPYSTESSQGAPVTYVGGQLAGLKSPQGNEVVSLTLAPITQTKADLWPGDTVYPPGMGKVYTRGGVLVVGRNVFYVDSTSQAPDESTDAMTDPATTPSPGATADANAAASAATAAGAGVSPGPNIEAAPPPGSVTSPPPDYAAIKEAPDPAYDPIWEVTYTEQANTVGVPMEEAIRPGWMGEDYANPNIGPKIYRPILGCDSIIDRISGHPLRAEYAMHCIEDAVDDLARAYLSISGDGFLASDWIRTVTDRPVATMADLVGSGGFFEYSSGDYEALYGLDLEIPLLQRARLYTKTTAGGATATSNQTAGGVVGASGNGAVQCDPALDPRRARRAYVLAYVHATGARPGMVG
jgi:hypothetical protein